MEAISSGFSFTVLSVYLGGRDAGGAQIAAEQVEAATQGCVDEAIADP
jgi:hypothetical protein